MRTIYIVCLIALLGAIMMMPAAVAQAMTCPYDICVNETGWWRNGGEFNAVTPSIYNNLGTGALNNANDGDTVFVYNGTYQNLYLQMNTPNVTLIGEDVPGGLTLSFDGTHGIEINAAGCVVDGFRIVNSPTGLTVGYSAPAPNCIIRNCVFDGMTGGDGRTINGINTTFENNIDLNTTSAFAIYVKKGQCRFVNNTIINASGNPGPAIMLHTNDCANCIITKNNVTLSKAGIATCNAGEGNKIYLNNFGDNDVTAMALGGIPNPIYWNSTEPIEYTYNGTTYTNYLGNYWSPQYTGTDGDGNGIGDTSYVLPDGLGEDYHPLMTGFENYLGAAAPTAPTPATPFLISGNVRYTSGGQVINPTVTVTNLATSEYFTVKTVAGSSYYLALTDSTHVSAGDIVRINVSDGTVFNETDHTVTASEMNSGGFVLDMLLERGGPDLVVTSKSEELLADGSFNVTYTVANIGDADADASTTSITIDGTEVANDSVPALAIGENYTNTVGPFECPCGKNVTVKVCADSDNEIAESNETNNCIENVLECPPCKPDLTVTGLTTPESIYANLSNTINATVSNIGEGDACAFNVSLLADGSVVDTRSVAGLTANESVNLNFTWTPTHAGEYELCVLTDSNDEIVESDETNNEYCENVTVLESKPELVIVRIALKTTGYVNEDNVLGVLVKNIGVLDAGSFDVSLSVDGTSLGEQTVTSLAAGESTELEYTWTPIEPGEHVLSATADTNNEVEEYNETNNGYTRISVIIKRTDWAQFHYNEPHIGFSPSDAPGRNATLWVSDDISAIGSTSPAVADGKVFVYSGPTGWSGGENAQLYCFDALTGNILWNVSIPAPEWGSWSSPAYHDGKVFTATGKETRCINASTGELIWTFVNPTGEASCNGGPVIADGKVVTNDWQGRHYYCLDEETGELLWTFTETNTGSWGTAYAQGTPAYADGKFYLTTWVYPGGNIYCVNASTGEVIWHQTTPLDTCGSPTVSNGIVYVTTYNFYGDGDIYALNATDGSILWHQTIQRTDSTPAVAYGNVYVAGGCPGYSEIQTYCFNATTGDLIWSTNVSEGIGGWTESVAVADGKVFVGKPDGWFDYAGTYALDAFTGDIIWSYPEGGASPAVADGVVFTIGGGKVYAFMSVESYGASVYYKKHILFARGALGEPDHIGAILLRNARIAIELNRTIPACRNVSVWVRKVGFRPASFSVYVSPDGESWTAIGSETCDSRRWTQYDFKGDWGDVKYIGITKPGTWWKPRIMALDAVHAEN